MEILELLKALKEIGIPIAAFTLCAWLVIYLVKKMAASIDKLVTRMEVFTNRVREEHDHSAEQHKNMMEQHREMITTLGRINGYKH